MTYQVLVTPSKRRKTVPRTRVKRKVVSGIKKKKKKPQRAKLVRELDTIFSQYIRVSHAKNGMVSCYTCGKEMEWKKAQCGHYVTRSIRMLRWDERNCRVQCYGCNVMHGGQVITFRENLVRDLGEDTVIHLEYLRHQLFSPSDEWLRERIHFYTAKVDSLRKDMVE